MTTDAPPIGLHLSRGVRALSEPLIVTEHYRGLTSGWLALISAHPERLTFQREFIEGNMPGARAGYGSRTYDVTKLGDGVYEAESVKAPTLHHRVYIEIRGGAIVRYSGLAGDAVRWLRERT